MNAINLTSTKKFLDKDLLHVSNSLLDKTGTTKVVSVKRMPVTCNYHVCELLTQCRYYLNKNTRTDILNIAETIQKNLPNFVNNLHINPYICAVILDCDTRTYEQLLPYLKVMNVLSVRV